MTPRTTGSSRATRNRERPRASHSMDAVISEAVALMDEGGDNALTFRALGARLGGGATSIYWYVSSKAELRDKASDYVIADVLEQTEEFIGDADPIDNLRAMALVAFDAIAARPWLADYFMRNTISQPNSLQLYERFGQQVLRLELTPLQSFHAVSAVLGFVVGSAADIGQQPPAGGARRRGDPAGVLRAHRRPVAGARPGRVPVHAPHPRGVRGARGSRPVRGRA
ncbi:TetR/AcrR family transcriptional regulator [Calidifontibacter indicus]|uniref:TetR/AcrR family transcriptional regulator n=1 Tax=Calidifontibacter indicus TaxID=419650 RepID=UPI003D75E9E7